MTSAKQTESNRRNLDKHRVRLQEEQRRRLLIGNWDLRFWDFVKKGDGDGCWVWEGHRRKDKYGVFCIRGAPMLAHRVSWLLAQGYLPDLLVCHHCDNPSCVRPDHIYLGTHQDNSNDRWNRSRGRVARGVHNAKAKLTEAAVVEIRASKTRALDLSRLYGVCCSTIHRIRARKCWSHIA